MDSEKHRESFDFGRLLKKHEKKHKSKPLQFVSVAGGVQKRIENSLKCRRSSRLTYFDSIRNLSRCASPAPLLEAQQKVDHRRQQLEKWKEEKEKKKKLAASQKKKPFLTGVPRAPLKYEPLPPAPLKFVPPPPEPVRPSTSGRVTRSQTARNTKQVKEKQTLSQSFAPKNATFKPPQLKKVPYVKLVALKPIKSKTTIYMFDPVLPKNSRQEHTSNEAKQTNSRAQNKPVEAKLTRKPSEVKTRSKITNASAKNSKTSQSSSSSNDCKSPVPRTRKSLPAPQSPAFQSSTETDSPSQSPILAKTIKPESPIKVRTRKSLPADSPILSSKSPRKQLTPKNPVPKSESSSEERLRSPKSPVDLLMTPERIIQEAKKISPCVTISRGKDNARKEMKKKLKEGLLDEDTSDIENIDHFRRQLASEIKRMTEMCEAWDRISEQTVLPDSIQECVLGAVGQARLLMSQKMQQFATLVERCARPEPSQALVTPADLHGFWDMVFMQVENVDMRFKKLEEFRARGWTEEAPAPVQRNNTRKPAPVAKKPVAGPSRLKEMIAAARKAKKEQQSPPPVEKTFEAGFFCVTSPVRCPAPHAHAPSTPLNKPSLLKAVLSNEAKKSASKNCASFAMLRASVLGKNVECEGVEPLPLTPLPQVNATPGRSILKQSTKKSSKKSIKVVLFDQPNNEYNTSLEDEPIPNQDKESDQEQNLDSGLSSINFEKEDKENYRRKSQRIVRQEHTTPPPRPSPRELRAAARGTRQLMELNQNIVAHNTDNTDAIDDYNSVVTRSRKSTTTPETRRSTRHMKEVETNITEEHTPKRSSRRRRGVGMEEETA